MSELVIDAILLVLVTITAIGVVEMRSLLGATMVLGIYSLLMALMWMNMDAADVAFTEAAVGAGISTVLLLGSLVIVGKDERHSPRVHWTGLLVVSLAGAALIYGTTDMPPFGEKNTPVHTHNMKSVFTNQLPSKAVLWEETYGRNITSAPHDPAAPALSHDALPSTPAAALPIGPALPEAHPPPADHAADKDEHKIATHSASPGGHHRADYFHGHAPNMVTAVIVTYRGFDTMFETAVIFTAALSLIILLRGRGRSTSPKKHEKSA